MKVFVFSNLAMSLDGKISAASREHFPLGTGKDRRQMLVLRGRCDAILMGASTVRAYRKPCKASPGSRKQPLNVVISHRLEGISPRWPFFKDREVGRILLVTSRVAEARLKKFEKTSQVILLKRPTRSQSLAGQTLKILAQRGVGRLLVEGGGEVMWHFVKDNAIDEYHVTVTPRVIGGAKAPTLVDGEGFLPAQTLNLKLKSCRRVQDELYLVYRKTEVRG